MREPRKVKVAVFGSRGRMGKEVISLLESHPKLSLSGVSDINDAIEALDLHEPNVVIDFSSPEGLKKIAKWCAGNNTPLVSGTTGVSEVDEKKISSFSRKIPLFRSANMSLGVNAMAHALKMFAQEFSDADIQIEEIHHRHKKDAPSGTAKFLHETLLSSGRKKIHIQPTVSLRGGEIFGIHKVYFFSKNEWVCFEHQAMNRSVFAEGAIQAALWLSTQRPGLYSMSHLLSAQRDN